MISRQHALNGDWQALYDEMRDMREACGDAHVKAILATGEVGDVSNDLDAIGVRVRFVTAEWGRKYGLGCRRRQDGRKTEP